ncbi:unnamed protein product [Durusdinium trenchii]|uniref:START domain-containing protein n=1 Tax=Durusdinium trenchii TaxID=1381693 RepID=A0ABP0L2N1_9DINO
MAWRSKAAEALQEALSVESTREWTPLQSSGEVRLFTSPVSGPLPFFRGCLERSAATVELADLVRVLVSDSCRRFWDPSYAFSQLLGHQDTMALLCTRQKASPVASESVWVNACTSNMSAERFTYAATSIEDADVGQSMPAAHAGLTRLATRLWAIDVRKKEDHWELSFVLHTAATSFRLPNFMLKPLLASWISSCLVSIWRMASAQAMLADPCSGDRGEYGGRAP